MQVVPACLNGCGPMRPFTWKETCANQDAADARYNEIIDDRDAEIRELIKNLAAAVQDVVRLDALRAEGVDLVEASARELERLRIEVESLKASFRAGVGG